MNRDIPTLCAELRVACDHAAVSGHTIGIHHDDLSALLDRVDALTAQLQKAEDLLDVYGEQLYYDEEPEP